MDIVEMIAVVRRNYHILCLTVAPFVSDASPVGARWWGAKGGCSSRLCRAGAWRSCACSQLKRGFPVGERSDEGRPPPSRAWASEIHSTSSSSKLTRRPWRPSGSLKNALKTVVSVGSLAPISALVVHCRESRRQAAGALPAGDLRLRAADTHVRAPLATPRPDNSVFFRHALTNAPVGRPTLHGRRLDARRRGPGSD
jgi:hypothetical protein